MKLQIQVLDNTSQNIINYETKTIQTNGELVDEK